MDANVCNCIGVAFHLHNGFNKSVKMVSIEGTCHYNLGVDEKFVVGPC
jgi:hypothetical protein